MPANKDLKRKIRARMQKTGERYTAARQHVLRARPAVAQSEKLGAAGSEPAAPGRSHAARAGMSDAAVSAKTGRTWAEWTLRLDARGAREQSHREIARSLVDLDGLSPWWSQTVTIGYERVLGRRRVGQMTDGSFATSKSKTFIATAAELYRCLRHARVREQWWQGEVPTVSASKLDEVVRMTMLDGSRAEISLVPKGQGKCTVSVQHRRLPSRDALAPAKAYWGRQLGLLAQHLRRG